MPQGSRPGLHAIASPRLLTHPLNDEFRMTNGQIEQRTAAPIRHSGFVIRHCPVSGSLLTHALVRDHSKIAKFAIRVSFSDFLCIGEWWNEPVDGWTHQRKEILYDAPDESYTDPRVLSH